MIARPERMISTAECALEHARRYLGWTEQRSDETGKPLDGANKYTLHFDKGQTPPVSAFWSVTLYDADGFQVANSSGAWPSGSREMYTAPAARN